METKADKIRKLIRDGLSDQKISKIVGCVPQYVNTIRYNRMNPNPDRMPAHKREIVARITKERWAAYRADMAEIKARSNG